MDEGALIAEMTKHGHTPDTARAAIAGRGIEDLWREYMGGTSGGGSGKSPEQLAQEYAQSIIDAQKKQIEEETKFLDQYTKDNPFIFDEELARKSALAEYQPYYSEILDDYLKQINAQRGSLQADVDLLKKIKEFDFADRSRQYEMAVSGAEEGWAGQGMFFSGLRQRNVGQKDVAYKTGLEEQGQRYEHQFGDYATQKYLFDLSEQEKRRDVGREQEEAVEGGVLTRKKEAMSQYYVPLEQSYYRKFPTGSGGSLKGYTVPDYYRM